MRPATPGRQLHDRARRTEQARATDLHDDARRRRVDAKLLFVCAATARPAAVRMITPCSSVRIGHLRLLTSNDSNDSNDPNDRTIQATVIFSHVAVRPAHGGPRRLRRPRRRGPPQSGEHAKHVPFHRGNRDAVQVDDQVGGDGAEAITGVTMPVRFGGSAALIVASRCPPACAGSPRPLDHVRKRMLFADMPLTNRPPRISPRAEAPVLCTSSAGDRRRFPRQESAEDHAVAAQQRPGHGFKGWFLTRVHQKPAARRCRRPRADDGAEPGKTIGAHGPAATSSVSAARTASSSRPQPVAISVANDALRVRRCSNTTDADSCKLDPRSCTLVGGPPACTRNRCRANNLRRSTRQRARHVAGEAEHVEHRRLVAVDSRWQPHRVPTLVPAARRHPAARPRRAAFRQ